jgi:hypothetical protein
MLTSMSATSEQVPGHHRRDAETLTPPCLMTGHKKDMLLSKLRKLVTLQKHCKGSGQLHPGQQPTVG